MWKASRNAALSTVVKRSALIVPRNAANLRVRRFISSEPQQTSTNLSDESDPKRDAIFKYSWGTWLCNDEAEKKRRHTKFSISGLHNVMETLFKESKETAKRTPNPKDTPAVVAPKEVTDNVVVLPHNVTVESLGTLNPNEKFFISQLTSLHEGKHHRIYKIETTTKKAYVLRIPYPLDSDHCTRRRIQSEVATLDFVDLKLGLSVPKVYAYGVDHSNPLKIPFILQEFIEGETLMKSWNPMTPRQQEDHHKVIKEVIDPIQEFQSKLAEIEFNKFGSLYFARDSDLPAEQPYDGETDPNLKNRWIIGPSTERVFWRNKKFLKKSQIDSYTGPWDADKPLDIINAVANVELENTRTRLALVEADSTAGDKSQLNHLVDTFTNLAKLAPVLMNIKTDKIKNVEKVFAPRLAHTELDPLNVIVKDDKKYLVDFECACIKPLIFQSTPRFVSYEDGPKIYEFEIDEDHYNSLDETEKYYYDFAVIRTRNEVLWDVGVNDIFKKLGTEGSPVLKRLRGPYIAAIERRQDNEFPLLDQRIYELMLQWNQFAQHGFVLSPQFPIEVSEKIFKEHAKQLEEYYERLGKVPFAVTNGWVPQDMFDSLLSQGIIKKLPNGDYEVEDISPEVKQPK